MPVPEALSRQVGPFPVWGWLSIGAAGIGGGMLLRRSSLFRDRTLDDPTADEGDVGSVPAPPPGFTPGIGYGGVLALAPSRAPEGDDVATTEADTNERWTARAVAWASNTQGLSAAAADTALRKYLQGREVNEGERAIIASVLARWGTPPEGAPPIDGPDEPAQPTPAKPNLYPHSRRHTTDTNQRWADIARVVYGSTAAFAYMRAANPEIIGFADREPYGRYPDPHQRLPKGLTIILP